MKQQQNKQKEICLDMAVQAYDPNTKMTANNWRAVLAAHPVTRKIKTQTIPTKIPFLLLTGLLKKVRVG